MESGQSTVTDQWMIFLLFNTQIETNVVFEDLIDTTDLYIDDCLRTQFGRV